MIRAFSAQFFLTKLVKNVSEHTFLIVVLFGAQKGGVHLPNLLFSPSLRGGFIDLSKKLFFFLFVLMHALVMPFALEKKKKTFFALFWFGFGSL